MARQHVTVALFGDGGDELVVEYDRYLVQLDAGLGSRVPVTWPTVPAILRCVSAIGDGESTGKHVSEPATQRVGTSVLPSARAILITKAQWPLNKKNGMISEDHPACYRA